MAAYIFYGKAGSGKGTQAAKLKEYLESQGRTVIYVETGNLFRNFVAQSETFAAQRTREIIDSGGLMPGFFPVALWANELIGNYTGAEDIILDGVARRSEEAQLLDSALDFFQIARRVIVHVHISDQTAIDRLAIRGQDRADDTDPEKVQTRLDWYRDNVTPVLDFFRADEGYLFAEINGEETVDGVWGQIREVVL